MPCRFPHCCCVVGCIYGGAIPNRDPTKPLFDRSKLREVAQRVGLANKIGVDAHPDFFLSADDMRMIEFALDFTAEQL